MATVQSIQRKLDKAYKKIGKKLGYEYSVYRPNDMPDVSYKTDPLDPAYWIDQKYSSFTKDDSYASAQSYGLPIWTTYIDGNDIKVGDIIYDVERDKTYTVISRDPIKPILSIETNSRLTIYDTTWDTTGGYNATDEVVATNLPANRIPGSGTGDSSFIPASTDTTIGLEVFTYRFWMPQNTVRSGMVVVDEDDNRSNIIQAVYEIDRGYVIRATEFHPNVE